MPVTILHNPRCSKSRQTLGLLEDRGITPTVVNYLETPPDEAELRRILALLGIPPRRLLRTGEQTCSDLGLTDPAVSDDQLIAAMVAHPILIERPIVINGDRAALGRPPESVLEIL